ncbi:MAG: signal peptidase I [Tumebacillaceae bacterium]
MSEWNDNNRPPVEDSKKEKRAGKEAWEWTKALLIAVVLAFLLRQFFLANFMVDGTSMVPTLQDREHLIVNKMVYHLHSPHYNDILVFKYPGDTSKDFIKRVIGLPGDKIEVREYKVFRNGKELNEPFIAEPTAPDVDPNHQTFVVPPNTVFVMGDNRNRSKDSRDPSVGYVPDANIVGRADLVFWPLKAIRFPRKS